MYIGAHCDIIHHTYQVVCNGVVLSVTPSSLSPVVMWLCVNVGESRDKSLFVKAHKSTFILCHNRIALALAPYIYHEQAPLC